MHGNMFVVFTTPEAITFSLTPNLVIKLFKAWYGLSIYILTESYISYLYMKKSLTLIIELYIIIHWTLVLKGTLKFVISNVL